MKTPTATRAPDQGQSLYRPRPKKTSGPQYLSWFSRLPVKHRAAIKKAYEQATQPT